MTPVAEGALRAANMIIPYLSANLTGSIADKRRDAEVERTARLIDQVSGLRQLVDHCNVCPVIRLGETLEEFRPRFQAWHREMRDLTTPALAI